MFVVWKCDRVRQETPRKYISTYMHPPQSKYRTASARLHVYSRPKMNRDASQSQIAKVCTDTAHT